MRSLEVRPASRLLLLPASGGDGAAIAGSAVAFTLAIAAVLHPLIHTTAGRLGPPRPHPHLPPLLCTRLSPPPPPPPERSPTRWRRQPWCPPSLPRCAASMTYPPRCACAAARSVAAPGRPALPGAAPFPAPHLAASTQPLPLRLPQGERVGRTPFGRIFEWLAVAEKFSFDEDPVVCLVFGLD